MLIVIYHFKGKVLIYLKNIKTLQCIISCFNYGSSPGIYLTPLVCIVKLQITSPSETLVVFKPNFAGMIIGWSFFKIAKIIEFHGELWLPWQPIKITLKKSLKINHLFVLKIILQKWLLGDLLTKLKFLTWFLKKHGRQRAWLIFP